MQVKSSEKFCGKAVSKDQLSEIVEIVETFSKLSRGELANTVCDDKGDTFGVGYVFTPWDSVELYGTYYLHMLDRDEGTDPDDINIFMTGARVKF